MKFNLFRNFLARCSAAWRAFTAPQSTPLAMLPETIHGDMFPALATPCQLGARDATWRVAYEGSPAEKTTQSALSFSEPTPAKPRRKRQRKPSATVHVLKTAPEPPVVEPWLQRLRDKHRSRIIKPDEADNLPATTSVAILHDRVLYRQPGETVSSFIVRVRSIVGDAKIGLAPIGVPVHILVSRPRGAAIRTDLI
jgi:hypothetical protein